MIYEVLLDGVNIHGMSEGLELLSGNADLELNGAGSCSFKMPSNHEYYDYPQIMKSTVDIVEGDEVIWTGRVVSISTNWNKEKTIEVEGALAYFNDSIQRPYVWQEVSLSEFFEDIIDTHNADTAVSADRRFKMGTFGMPDITVTKSVNYTKTFDVIQDLCIGEHGGYIFIRKEPSITVEGEYDLYIDWVPSITKIGDQPVQFGINLLDLSTELSATDIVTRIIPISNDANGNTITITTATSEPPEGYTRSGDILICDDAEEIFGGINEVVTFDDISTPNALLRQGVEWLKAKQFDHLSIECDVAELKYIDPDYMSFEVGESVRVISTPHIVDKTLTITKMSYDLMSASKKVTMGNPPRQSLSEMTGTGSTGGTSAGSSSGGGGGGGGGGGSVVSVEPIILTGTDIADITVNGRTFTLKYDVSSLESSVSTLESDVSSIKSNINAIEGNITNITSDIDSLEDELESKADSTDVYTKTQVNTLIEDFGEAITLTQAEYDALDEEEKLDLNKVYYILDGEGGGGGASSISELEDVELTDLADGEILKYDSVLEKWVNAELGVPAVHYDDTERVIGTWFGETLYRKCFSISGGIACASNTWVDTGISVPVGVSKVISSIASANSACNASIIASCDNSTIYIMNLRNASVTIVDFTIEYTKTTT